MGDWWPWRAAISPLKVATVQSERMLVSQGVIISVKRCEGCGKKPAGLNKGVGWNPFRVTQLASTF